MAVRARALVDLGALRRNVGRMADAAGGAQLCAVVKADAYGHGMVPVAGAALEGGAGWLAVATAEEARALRAAGIGGRVLVMGALSDEELPVALEADADVVAWRTSFVERVAADGGGRVHVKLDSGMGRLGTRDPAEATDVAELAAQRAQLAGLMSHFATADDPGDDFFGEQLERFRAWAVPLHERFPDALLHIANSAGTLRSGAAHFDMVRCGIAIYGMDPFGEDPARRELEPVLSLRSYVAEVKPCAPGESAGYGRRFIAREQTTIATVPIGYGDGWRRSLSPGGEALIAGRRFPIAGTISMDNITLDLGPQPTGVAVGDEVVLIGRGGDERILAEDVARSLGTINYEVTCGLTARVPREHMG
jgi:alanine racemase